CQAAAEGATGERPPRAPGERARPLARPETPARPGNPASPGQVSVADPPLRSRRQAAQGSGAATGLLRRNTLGTSGAGTGAAGKAAGPTGDRRVWRDAGADAG